MKDHWNTSAINANISEDSSNCVSRPPVVYKKTEQPPAEQGKNKFVLVLNTPQSNTQKNPSKDWEWVDADSAQSAEFALSASLQRATHR